jgi:hypothetical protein
VVRRIGGQSTAVASTGLSPVGDGVTLAVTMKGSRVEVAVEGRVRASVVDRFLTGARGVGVVAAGPDAGRARFDDFRVALSDGRPPPRR